MWPDAGKIADRQSVSDLPVQSDSESDVFRTTAFIKLNASERTDGLISKLVGNHTITGLFETREASSYNRNGHLYKWGIDYAEFGT